MKRFGRKQKRKLKEEITRLEKALCNRPYYAYASQDKAISINYMPDAGAKFDENSIDVIRMEFTFEKAFINYALSRNDIEFLTENPESFCSEISKEIYEHLKSVLPKVILKGLENKKYKIELF